MKNLKIMNMLLGGLLVLGSLTSCGSDDSNDPTPPPTPEPPTPEKVLTSVRIDYTATVSQQLLDVAAVTVRYIGENGQVASEQISSTTWTKSVTIPLPNKAGLNIQPTLKGSVAEGEYNLSAKGQMAYTWLDQNGQLILTGLTVSTPPMEGVFYDGSVGTYLKAIASKCQVARAFTTDYTVNNATISMGTTDDESTQNTGISDEVPPMTTDKGVEPCIHPGYTADTCPYHKH